MNTKLAVLACTLRFNKCFMNLIFFFLEKRKLSFTMDAVLEKLHVIFQSNKNRQVFMAYDTFHELINLLPLIKTMKDRGPLLMLLRLQVSIF